MPNNLDDQVMTEVINYSKAFKDKLDVKFEGFFKGSNASAFKKQSLRFLEGIRPTDALLKKSSDEYSKVTEVADKNLQTSLRTDLDGLNGEISSNVSICAKAISNFRKQVQKGYITAPDSRKGKAFFILSKSVDQAKKYSDIIIKKSNLIIKKFDKVEMSKDKNFIRSHNIMMVINTAVLALKKIIGQINFSYGFNQDRDTVEEKSIFDEKIIQKITCGDFEATKDSSMLFKFTRRSFKRVDAYLRKNEILANQPATINSNIKRDFVNFLIGDSNSAEKREDFSSYINGLQSARIEVLYENSSEPELKISFLSPPQPGTYYKNSDSGISGSSYTVKVTAQSSKSKRVEKIIKNAIGEAPLYKCKHKGKWYYYTPAQLVLGGGKLTDSSGKKFKPKNGKPASLSRYKK